MRAAASWPVNEMAGNPWQDEPIRLAADPYDDWVEHGGGAWDRSRYDSQVQAVRERMELILGGQVPTPDPLLDELAAPLGLLRPLGHDVRDMPLEVPELASLEQIARIAQDILPDCGDRPDHVLGPWFEELDPRCPEHRRALLTAASVWCFAAAGEQLPAFTQWCRQQPPLPSVRRTIRAVGQAPLSLWGLQARVGERWELRDLVGLGERWQPAGPVLLDRPGAVAGGLHPGGLLAARVVPNSGRPVAMMGLVLPEQPPIEQIAAWVRFEGARMRLTNQRQKLEGLLRQWGHVLVRRAHCWAWSNHV